MPVVSDSTSASELDSSSSEEDSYEGGSDFLSSLGEPEPAGSGIGTLIGVESPLSRSAPVPGDDEALSPTDDEPLSPTEEPTPSSVEEQFRSVADGLASDFRQRQRGEVVERLRELKSRVGARLGDVLGEGAAGVGAALGELDKLIADWESASTWQKQLDLFQAALHADNSAQLQVLSTAAADEAGTQEGILMRTKSTRRCPRRPPAPSPAPSPPRRLSSRRQSWKRCRQHSRQHSRLRDSRSNRRLDGC